MKDPRELMRERISSEEEPDEDPWASDTLLHMHDWAPFDDDCDSLQEEAEVELDESLELSNLPSLPPSPVITPSSPPPIPLEERRWAKYPTTLFSSDLLPVSQIQFPLPSMSGNPPSAPSIGSNRARVSETFDTGRRELWEKIVRGKQRQPPPEPKPLPPWRRESAFDFKPLIAQKNAR